MDTGRYLLKVDGQVLEMDTMAETTAPALLFMGDGSSACAGLAEVRNISMGVR